MLGTPERYAGLDIEALRRLLNHDEVSYELLSDNVLLPPLLKNEVDAASRALNALKNVEVSDLEAMRSAATDIVTPVHEHWTKIYKDPIAAGWFFSNLPALRGFLKEALLCDYGRGSSSSFPAIRGFARARVSAKQRGRDNYQARMVSVIEEMMLDREHVEMKLNTLVQHETYYSGIPGVIGDCRWEDLARTLCKDRELATTLHQQDPFKDSEWKKICGGIERILKEYFDGLVDAKHFRLSQKAEKLTAKRNTAAKPPSYSALYGSEAIA